jgi:nucleoside-diphosphate-sugar epimerase
MNNVRAVVHLAGIVGDPASSLDDQLTRQLNIVTTRMVKEQVKAFKIPRLIFASSCSVYGASNEVVTESSGLHPVSLYAQTKIDAEQELLADSADEFNPIILRFATVFGHSKRMRFDLVVNLFTAQAYMNGEITVKGSTQWRPFIHTADIAQAIVKVIEAPIDKVSRQIFNIGDDRLNTTIGQLAETVKQIVSKDRHNKTVRVTVNDNIDDLRNYHVSFEKIHRILGYQAGITLEAGIAEMYRHLKHHDYLKPFTDKIYSNMEMTKLIQKEFHSENYRKSHFTSLNGN